ncbi:MAG TPA: c-type cytochrome [Candidatus Binatia bacterium]
MDARTAGAERAADGARLAAELGCAACHAGLDVESPLRERAPDLSYAGLRWRRAYLFDYLQRPRAVRRHIGASRMPDFALDEREALALTLFLAEQRAEPPLPHAALEDPARPRATGEDAQISDASEEQLVGDLREHSCLACHTWRGAGGVRGPELADAGARLDPAWLRRFLVAPDAYGVADGVMPALLWRAGPDGRAAETVPGAGRALERIVAATDALAREQRAALEARFREARDRHPEIDAAAGERVFRALGCAACHPIGDVDANPDAPDLASEGIRVKPEWLRAYLRAPSPVRPSGGQPGSGSRMPDFRLTEDEVEALAAFLGTRRRGAEHLRADGAPAPLGAVARRKVETLLDTRLACLGCHALGERGGRIGPNLAAASERLEPAFVEAMVRDPQLVVPHAAMPKLPLPARTRELVVRYLVHHAGEAGRAPRERLSPLDLATSAGTDATAGDAGDTGAALYGRLCAACHGARGDGDGFNARFLPVRPTAHADASYLATRADDTLFDGIAAGAAILGRSHLMPAWGETLSTAQIRDLVAHLRELCRCEAPAWTRDGDPDAPTLARSLVAPLPASTVSAAPSASAPAAGPAQDESKSAPAAKPARLELPLPAPTPLPTITFDDFVGAEACRECHARQYDLWAASTHGKAGGAPRDVRLIAPFDGTPLRFADAVVTPQLGERGEPFFVVEHEDGRSERLDVVAVVGGGHLIGGGTQTFFARFPDGTLRFLPFDFIRGEGVWFGQRRDDGSWQPVDETLALTDLANWPPQRILGNGPFANCDVCHGSQIQVLPLKGERVLTRMKSLKIDCEACHGPGRQHVAWARSPDRDAASDDFMASLDTLDKDGSLRVCFQCHASRPVLDPDYLSGRPFENSFALKYLLFEDNPYFADGRIRTFSYQDNHQFSDCYVNGSMTCVDCHDPHAQTYRDVNGRALAGRFDDGQCTGCHASKAERSELHTHHPDGSPGDACTACHMPFLQQPTVGRKLRFTRSDHTIAIPRPAFDASLPIEGACRQCHPERSVEELQRQTEAWWGPLKPHPPAVAAVLEAERTTDVRDAARLLLRPGDKHVIGQFAALARFTRRFLAPDRVPEDEVLERLRALAASEDLDVSSLALASLHYAAGERDDVRTFLVEALEDAGPRDRALRLRWGSALRTLAQAHEAAGDARGASATRRKLGEVLPFGVQSRPWIRAHFR